jgi:hypothetical protein
VTAAQAQEQARDILADDRFHEGRHGGNLVRDALGWLGDRVRDLADAVPGGQGSDLVALALLVALVAAALGSWSVRRRARASGAVAVGATALAAAPAGPEELERAAVAAERDGALDRAVRLRFTAGLLRLDAAQAIELAPSSTTGAVGRALRSPRFDALAEAHDAIAYGGRRAAPEDAAAAREQWPVLVGEVAER